jgi:hypothetical protein
MTDIFVSIAASFVGQKNFLENEKQSWIDNANIGQDLQIFEQCKELLERFELENLSYICYVERTFNSSTLIKYKYQHWFLMNHDHSVIFEFGGPTIDHHSARVRLFEVDEHHYKENQQKIDYIVHDAKHIKPEMKNRMRLVLGMSRYSLALRNCEHVANFVFNGLWRSYQMNADGFLATIFRNYIMGKDLIYSNKSPIDIAAQKSIDTVPKYDFQIGKEIFDFSCCSKFPENFPDDTYKILFLGIGNCQKSNVINALFNKNISWDFVGSTENLEEISMPTNKDVYFLRGTVVLRKMPETKRNLLLINTFSLPLAKQVHYRSELSILKNQLKSYKNQIKDLNFVCIVFNVDEAIQYTDSQILEIKNILKWLKYYENPSRYLFIGNSLISSSKPNQEIVKIKFETLKDQVYNFVCFLDITENSSEDDKKVVKDSIISLQNSINDPQTPKILIPTE